MSDESLPFPSTEIPPTKCSKPADVLLMVDSSGSITAAHFNKVRLFLKELVSRFNISKDGTNVGLLQFGTRTKLEFGLNRYDNVRDIKKHIRDMPYLRGRTYLGGALRRARIQVGRRSRVDQRSLEIDN